jgi:predicted ATP-grasp superfamily ATP-dependent carboligase
VVQVPDAAEAPAAFVQALGEAAVSHEVELVLPGSERDLIALTEHRSRFPLNVRLAIPRDPTALDRATDKFLLPAIAAGVRLLWPPSRLVARDASAPPDLPGPWVVKPRRSETRLRNGRLAHGNTRCAANHAELRQALNSLPGDQLLLQAHLDGPLCGVAGVAHEGEVICAEQRVAHRIWPPGCGQMAYAESVPLDSGASDALAHAASLLRWTGVIQLQFIETPEGRYLLDLNPRIYASLGLALAAGLNLTAIWAQLELDRDVEIGRYKPGVRFRSEPLDSQALLATLRHRALRPFLAGIWPRRRTSHAIFALRDPLPLRTGLASAFARLSRERSRRPRYLWRQRPDWRTDGRAEEPNPHER